jgi:hypothetical protein
MSGAELVNREVNRPARIARLLSGKEQEPQRRKAKDCGTNSQPLSKFGEINGRFRELTRELYEFAITLGLGGPFLLIALGDFGFVLGWQYFYDQRRALGSALVVAGGSLVFGGIGLGWLL